MAAIDIGPGAIDRGTTGYGNYTVIDMANAANATGKITSIELWMAGSADATDLKAGTLQNTSGDNFTPRDYETIGTVTRGSKQTFSGLDCDVATGDYAGVFWSATAATIEMDLAGGSGNYRKAGDQFDAGDQDYGALKADRAISIYGTGETITPPQTLSPSAIASAEAFGTTKLNLTLFPSGIASAEAFGTPIVISGLTIYPSAIPSAEAFGNLIIAGPLIVLGIASQEAFGSPTVSPGGVSVAPSGISSEELFGLPKLNLFVTPSGIVSGEAFGAARLLLYLLPTGIASAEAFGTATVKMILVIRPSGIASVEAFGTIKIIVILAKGTDMKLPLGIPGQAPIPSGEVSIPSKEVSI